MSRRATPPTSRRGRTRAGRLSLIDTWLARELTRDGSAERTLRVVDVGYGDQPLTTLALHERLRDAGLRVESVGVEREPSRVEAARAHAAPGLRFVRGDFELHASGLARADLVRAMNVLRAYGLEDTRRALATLGLGTRQGGLLVEGTSDTEGHVATAHLWRRRGSGMGYDGLLLCCDGARGFSPWLLRDHLPRDLRRHVRAPEPVHGLLADWAACWERTRTADPRASFVQSVEALAEAREDVDFDPWLAQRGIAHWRPQYPSPRPEVFDGTLTTGPHGC